MEFMGFGVRWRSWIQGLLKNARSSVLVNGSPTEEFNLLRGLRQGDLISHFLFLIAMEGLHIVMEDAVVSGNFRGVEIEEANLEISHLFYADVALFLGVGVNQFEVISLASIMGCAATNFPFSYLGILVGGSMSCISSWDVIVDRFRNRLSKWKVKMLSIGGRLTLVKSVLRSLGIYFFSLFRMPVTIFHLLESFRARFFGVWRKIKGVFIGSNRILSLIPGIKVGYRLAVWMRLTGISFLNRSGSFFMSSLLYG
ncbi:uncharacterized protein LOC122196643 [Lactuca sativa]|uniref:uncharacterized protein LOC122196643 n=1 Tax=Lactuca sativa TaxID=4236 RepID=UPI001C690BF5|nr:uncharacterized protein LOC122196643 [Lactuca sativa]